MTRGIMVFGASGSGTTTIGKALAMKLGYKHFDADDYLWETTSVPYTVMRGIQERSLLLYGDLIKERYFVLSGSICGWDTEIVPLLDIAVLVFTPTEVRLSRIKEREWAKWGERLLPSGDMHNNHLAFLEWASAYDNAGADSRSRILHETWAAGLPCPVLQLNGTLPLVSALDAIIMELKSLGKELPLT